MDKASKLQQRKFRFSTYEFRNYCLYIAFGFSCFDADEADFWPVFQFLFHGRMPFPTAPDGEIDPAVAESPGLVDSQLSALRVSRTEAIDAFYLENNSR